MALAYYGTNISPNQTETAEGYLICRNVPIARTGRQDYLARELMLDGDPDRIVSVERNPEDVFEAATLASFEGKPVTDGHPPENVGPENFAAYVRGHVQNVRRAGEYIVADLYINDANLASEVRNGVKREVSCGYLCNYEPVGTGFKQSRIRGNHVAIVPRGRAGHDVAIKDAAPEAEKGRKCMRDFLKNILTAFGMAARDASPEELDTMVEAAATALDAAPAGTAPAPEAEPAGAGASPEKDALPAESAMDKKLDAILDLLAKLMPKEEALHDEGDLDDMIEKLAGKKEGDPEAAVTVPAEEMEDMSPVSKDAAAELLRRVRPAVASIQDRQQRARVVDALLATLSGGSGMETIVKAAQDSAIKAAEASRRTTYEQACAESQANYDALNPHKGKE